MTSHCVSSRNLKNLETMAHDGTQRQTGGKNCLKRSSDYIVSDLLHPLNRTAYENVLDMRYIGNQNNIFKTCFP
jgi:hypothetical protein